MWRVLIPWNEDISYAAFTGDDVIDAVEMDTLSFIDAPTLAGRTSSTSPLLARAEERRSF